MPSLHDLERQLGLIFADLSLLDRALTHRSFLNENPHWTLEDNERLEFLGDAVLDFVVGEYLYHHFPEGQEGELTSLRAALVRTETLAEFGRQIELGRHLRLGRGEEEGGGRGRPALVGSAFEALVGALYLDQGIETTATFITRFIAPAISHVLAQELKKDPKSRLQEWSQGHWHLTPTYRTVAERGPDHAKEFTVEVLVGNEVYGRGTGPSKQAAEQAAAKAALADLESATAKEPRS